MDERQYTVKEIATHFQVSRQAIYDWITEGKLRAVRLGDRIRVPESALKAFIQEINPGEQLSEEPQS